MSLPTSLRAYADCMEVWERAVESAAGVRVILATQEDAHRFRMRMHQARKYHRIEAERIYSVDHPKWGKSDWDPYEVKMRYEGPPGPERKWILLVVPVTTAHVIIEEIEPMEQLSYETPRQLPAPEPTPEVDDLPEAEPEPEPPVVEGSVQRRF